MNISSAFMATCLHIILLAFSIAIFWLRATLPKHKRTAEAECHRNEKRIAITIDILLRERLSLPLDRQISCPRPTSDFVAIAWVKRWAGCSLEDISSTGDPAETVTQDPEPVTQVMSPITDTEDNDN